MSEHEQLMLLWHEIALLKQRISELEHDDSALTFLALRDGVTAPSAVAGLALIYVDAADGDLKVVFGDSAVKLIVADT